MIKQSDGSALSIGQLVEIKDGNDLVGYEFGFGVETFASRLHQTKSIFDTGVGRSFFVAHSSHKDRQYQDLLVSTMAMHCAGTMPGKNGRSAVLRKAINQLVAHEFLNDSKMEDQNLKLIYSQVADTAGSGKFEDYGQILKGQRKLLTGKIDLFRTYKKERLHLVEKGNGTLDYAHKKIKSYADKIGLPEKVFKVLSCDSKRALCVQKVNLK